MPIEVVASLLRGEKFPGLLAAPTRPGAAVGVCRRQGRAGRRRPQALVRECQEELGVTVSVGRPVLELTHAYPDLTIHLTLFAASLTERSPSSWNMRTSGG